MNPCELTAAFVTALTGHIDTVVDWRVINDKNKGDMGRNIRGSLNEVYSTLQEYNSTGWGVFICVNAMDGRGQKLENIAAIRTHYADLDDVFTSADAYQRAISSPTPPHFAVQTSPNKYHLYWLTEPYVGNDFFSTQQRKIIQLYNADKQCTDATRVLRVPGFFHNKEEPKMVICWQLYNGPRYTHAQIEQALVGVNVIAHFSSRKELGSPELAAPSLEYLSFALNLFDPNELVRAEWMPLTAAFKQAGWSLATEQVLLDIWQTWCARFTGNNLQENMKLWNSIKDSEVGWGRFERLSNIKAYYLNRPTEPPKFDQNYNVVDQNSTDGLPDILDAEGKKKWFKDCYFIAREGKIFSATGRFMNQTQFNGLYGGKEFCLKEAGAKVTDEAWKAALRSTDWAIPKVDHVRFLPERGTHEIIVDELGRKGLNTYIPARIVCRQNDITPWLDFLGKILPTSEDVKIFNDYIAHNVKFPGYKIPWGILIQSERGIGKQMIGSVVKYCVGESYTYEPDAEKLVSGASSFNGWVRNKLMIIVDEIRVGDRRDLLEGLKKIITDKRIAVESKGVDQEMDDNLANWIFFSNYKDAIPISENERRYCVFYSLLQSAAAIERSGMDKGYFDRMFKWLETDGYAALAYWYKNYNIEKGSLPHRAPKTSSYAEVIRIGRTPLEILIDEKIENKERGFRAGYISWPMLLKAVQQSSMRFKPPEYALKSVLETKGYREIGYTPAPVGGEDILKPSLLYACNDGLTPENYEIAQSA